jgi:hypothetical protein
LEAGLALQFIVMPKAIEGLKVPKKVLDQCGMVDYESRRKVYLASPKPKNQTIEAIPDYHLSPQGWNDTTWIDEERLMADVSFRRSKLKFIDE